MSKNIRILCAGGAGVNIGALLEEYAQPMQEGFAKLDIAYVDTSRSNLAKTTDQSRVYLITTANGDELDGSGQKRDENPAEIAPCIPEILHTFKPGDLTIVIHSGAGGSGSVIGPMLTSELIARGQPVIVVMVGDSSTRKFAENTLKTIKSYEGVVQQRQSPVVMHFMHNDAGLNRTQVNKQVTASIVALAALFSGQNHGLDSADLSNFINFHRVTSFKPAVTHLAIMDAETNGVESLGNPISVATLSIDVDSFRFPMTTDYQCYGVLPQNATMRNRPQLPCHFVTCDGVIMDAVTSLKRGLKDLDDAQNARVSRQRILDADDKVGSDGMVY